MLLVSCTTTYDHYVWDYVYVLNEYQVRVNSVQDNLTFVNVLLNEGDTETTKVIRPHYVYKKVNILLSHLEITIPKENYEMRNEWFGLKEHESDDIVSMYAIKDYSWEGHIIEPNTGKTFAVYFEIPENKLESLNILEVDLSRFPLNGVNIYLGSKD
jgi:hypothetical protein